MSEQELQAAIERIELAVEEQQKEVRDAGTLTLTEITLINMGIARLGKRLIRQLQEEAHEHTE